MSSPAPAWTVSWHRSTREIPAELWAKCFRPPLEGLWWYLALEDSGLEDQFQFHYALLSKGGAPAGIAPAFVFNVPIDLVAPPLIAKLLKVFGGVLPRLRYQRTFFIGSPCADEGTLGLIDPADLPAAVAALQSEVDAQARATRAPMIVWKDFLDAQSSAFADFVRSKALFRVPSYPGTRLDLSGRTFDDYLKSLSGSHRHNVKKKLKRSHALGNLEVSVVERLDDATLEEVFGLFWQTYEKGKTKFEVLNCDFFRNIQRFEGSRFVLLRDPATGKLAAFMLCFHIGERAINKFIGIDYKNYEGNWFMYFRLWEAAVTWAASVGATDFQSGQTGYSAKILVGHSLVALTNFCRHRNRLMHKIFAKVASGITWASLDSDLKTYLAAHPEAEPKAEAHAG